MVILGIGGILHDAACALLRDAVLVAAMEEHKLARRHTSGELPEHAMDECLRIAGLKPDQIDCVALARPLAPRAESAVHMSIRARFAQARIVVVEHHSAHAASAFFASPFEQATVLTLDRFGDFRCGARWNGQGNDLTLDQELYFPDSLGDLYSRVTELLGFQGNADEHKVQWLSTYGDERYVGAISEIFDWQQPDWPRLNRAYFDRDRGALGGFSERLFKALGLPDGTLPPEKERAHIAAGLQKAVEGAVERMAGSAKRLCLAGGLSFNALLIAFLEQKHEVFVQPAGGNAGTALGAALHAWAVTYGRTERVSLEGLCLGPQSTPDEVKRILENCKLRFRYLLTSDELIETAVRLIGDNQIVAWMHGRMEFGPRALGNRSILASPLNPYSTENLNLFIKRREPFRKFAASVPAERADAYFETGSNSRYLASVSRVRAEHRKTFAAAILGEDLVRVHKVNREDNPLYHRLLEEAGRQTGLPVLYNTSFNLFEDPIVCSPRDAARSFYSSGIDAMFVGQFLLTK